MAELNFCPYCNAPQHKVASITEKFHFCKECDKFFSLEHVELACPKCESKKLCDSDFPTPDGKLVIQCTKCKKMMSMGEFLQKIGYKPE